jgi:hypothetical protein
MIDRPYTPTLARLIVSVGALLLVGIPAYFSVVHGNAIDVGALIYAIPISAIAFAVFASIGYRLVAIAPVTPIAPTRAAAWRVGRHPLLHLALCVAGLTIAGIFFVLEDADASAFNADPSCTLALTYEPPDAGACTLARARIDDAWMSSSRNGTSYHLHVTLADGSQSSIELSGPRPIGFWHAASYGTDRSATVQLYRGRIVAIATQAGRSETMGMPSQRLRVTFAIAIVLAVFGLISAVRILLFSPQT